jgi:signal recognition particle GTPase
MLNFMKGSIFSRNTSKAIPEEQEPDAQVLAVWGSPGSGKTTVSVRLAKYLADRKKNVVLLLCDMTAPCCLVSARLPSWNASVPWEAFLPPPM